MDKQGDDEQEDDWLPQTITAVKKWAELTLNKQTVKLGRAGCAKKE